MSVVDGDIVRVVARQSYGEDDIQNVYHCRYTGPDIGDDDFVDEVADALDTAHDAYNVVVASSIDYDTIWFWNVTQDRPLGEVAWPTLTVGGSGADIMPLQTAPLVLFNTAAPRSQGRKYLCPTTETATNAGGVLASPALTALVNYATYILGTMVVGSGTASWGTYNPTLTRFAEFVSAVVRDLLHTQRRRTPGVGS
jgi:hypothetical protein